MADAGPIAPGSDDVVRIAARAYERDRYLAALLSPRAVRGDLIAVAAFAGEVGRIPAYVSEPMMGRIRLQWWRERIDEGTSGGHPVADAMISCQQRHNLPGALLTGLIDAHEDSLEDRPFADMIALRGYIDRIDGALFEMARLITGSPPQQAFVEQVGRAYGLARVLAETPAVMAQGRLLLPVPNPDHIQAELPALVSATREHLAACTATVRQLSRDARCAVLPLALVEPYLQALEHKQNFAAAAVEVDPLKRVWRLWRCRWTGRI
jgi:15-cis-phytoene synthase